MDIENVAGVLKVLNNHFEKQKEKQKKFKRANKVFYSQSSSVSISSNASKISEIYETLQKSGNETAMQAFRDSMVQFAQSGDEEDFVHFVHTMEDIAEEDPALLEKVFTTVAEIETRGMEKGYNLNSIEWLSNIGYMKRDEVESYISTTEHILSFSDAQMGEAFQDFVQTTEVIVKNRENHSKELNSYFDKTQALSDGGRFITFNKEFADNIQNDK